jgi:hypothetical protein
MSDELNPTEETAVETPAEESAEATEATETSEETADESEESEEESEDDSSEPAEPAVYQPVAIGEPITLDRFGYKIYIVNAQDEITLTQLMESGKTMGNIVSNACTANDHHDECIVAIRN